MLTEKHVFIPHGIMECSWYCKPKLSAMYFRLLFKANYCDCEKFGIAVKSGQVLVTPHAFASWFKAKEGESMTVLRDLKKYGGVLEIKKIKGYLLITVNEYNELMQDELDKYYRNRHKSKNLSKQKIKPVGNKVITYSDLLKHPLWQKKRLEILNRDGFRCTKCGSEDKNLQVHHLYYTKGLKPWEYPDDAFVTLCEECHESEHKSK